MDTIIVTLTDLTFPPNKEVFVLSSLAKKAVEVGDDPERKGGDEGGGRYR